MASNTYWFLCALTIYGVGTVLYISVLADFEKKHRNHRNWHYMVLLVALPAFGGFSPRFRTNRKFINVLYYITSLSSIVFYGFVGAYLYNFLKIRLLHHQIASVRELIDHNFDLIGSNEVLKVIQLNPIVSFYQNVS